MSVLMWSINHIIYQACFTAVFRHYIYCPNLITWSHHLAFSIMLHFSICTLLINFYVTNCSHRSASMLPLHFRQYISVYSIDDLIYPACFPSVFGHYISVFLWSSLTPLFQHYISVFLPSIDHIILQACLTSLLGHYI